MNDLIVLLANLNLIPTDHIEHTEDGQSIVIEVENERLDLYLTIKLELYYTEEHGYYYHNMTLVDYYDNPLRLRDRHETVIFSTIKELFYHEDEENESPSEDWSSELEWLQTNSI
jgi:hypothetical protein